MTITILSIAVSVSIIFNALLVWYVKTSLSKLNVVYTASEEVAEIFTLVDTYGEHLQSVYEKPMFYGDETLQGLLDHTKQMMDFLKRYESVYSFTQPDLEEQLSNISWEPE